MRDQSNSGLLEENQKLFRPDFQTQGYRWIEYLDIFMEKETVATVVKNIRNAKTWLEAVDVLSNTFHGVGPYTAAQSLCNLFWCFQQQKRFIYQPRQGCSINERQSTKWTRPRSGNKSNIWSGDFVPP